MLRKVAGERPESTTELEDRHAGPQVQFPRDQFQLELLRLIEQVELHTHRTLELSRLSDVVRLSAEASELWTRVLSMAHAVPSPITFFDAAVHIAPMMLLRGTQEAVDYYRLLVSELEHRVAEGIGAVHEEHRFYWDGPPVWSAARTLADIFAARGIAVVQDGDLPALREEQVGDGRADEARTTGDQDLLRHGATVYPRGERMPSGVTPASDRVGAPAGAHDLEDRVHGEPRRARQQPGGRPQDEQRGHRALPDDDGKRVRHRKRRCPSADE